MLPCEMEGGRRFALPRINGPHGLISTLSASSRRTITQMRVRLRGRGKPEVDRWPRRVLVMSWRDPWHPEAGGAEVMLYEHVRRWVRQGHEITILTAHYPGAAREQERDGLRIVRAGNRFTVYIWAAVLYLVRLRRQTDAVLDIENGIPFFTPLYVRKPRLCLVHHVHRDQFLSAFGPVAGRVGRFLESTMMPLIYRHTPFMAVSESTRRELAAIGIPPERCSVVHNGLDHAAYRRVIKRSATPRLLYVGRLKRHKRVDLIIDLAARLRERVPDLVLDIAGTGDDADRLQALVKQRGLQDVVRFHGFTSHARKVALYSYTWALVTTTEREGWGLSVMEAAACGAPALSLDVPGVRDAIAHGISGWLAPDLEGLYQSALRLLTDKPWRQRLSEGALERSHAFSWRTSAAGARAALAEAWLDHAPVSRRRASAPAFHATLVFSRGELSDSTWQTVPAEMRGRLRAGDRVAVTGDELQVTLAVTSESELPSVESRLRRILGDLARRPEPEVNAVRLARSYV